MEDGGAQIACFICVYKSTVVISFNPGQKLSTTYLYEFYRRSRLTMCTFHMQFNCFECVRSMVDSEKWNSAPHWVTMRLSIENKWLYIAWLHAIIIRL